VRLLGIAHTKPYIKFEVFSSSLGYGPQSVTRSLPGLFSPGAIPE